jgi:Transglutaminase-like superfamily
MFRNSAGFGAGELSLGASEADLRWLRGTHQLDVMSPKLRTKVLSLTQLKVTDQEKAVCIYDFVKAMPFACVADYSILNASDVLKMGHGDCFTKGMLFVAMLRAAQIPARLRFASLPIHFLRGIIEPEEASIVHAMAEVRINEQWWVVDSYVPDVILQQMARTKLVAQGLQLGYGIHVNGDIHWDGASHASSQCSAADPDSLPVVDWGFADDPESFYAQASHSELRRNFATRMKWRLATPMVNKRVAAIRKELI